MPFDFFVDSQSFQELGKDINCGCLWLLLLFLGFLPVKCLDLGTLFKFRSEGEPLCQPIDVELNFSGSDTNVCVCGTQERPSQNEGVLASTSISRMRKSMGIKKFRILTGMFSAIPAV